MSFPVLRTLTAFPGLASAAQPGRPVAHRRSLLFRVRQQLCGIRTGHDLIRRAEPGRLRLVCRDCLYETTGWETGRR